VNLNHFRLLRVVGKGAFGKVRIVERKDTGSTFALKYIRKDEGMFSSPFTLPTHFGIFFLLPRPALFL
jgi:serine/threonine kinase 32